MDKSSYIRIKKLAADRIENKHKDTTSVWKKHGPGDVENPRMGEIDISGEAGPHPNIVGYHSCSACGSHLVLNYIDGVDLLDVVQQQGGVKGGALVSLFAQMYAGVRHMYAVAILVPSIGRLACAA